MKLRMPSALIACCLTLGSVPLFAQAAPPAPSQVQTEQERRNIAVVMGWFHKIWEQRDPTAPPQYMAKNYIEHSDGGRNGIESWMRARPLPPPEQRTTITSQTAWARGDFVILLQDRVGPHPSDPSKNGKYSQMELFRVYDGLLQEHWRFLPAEPQP